MNILRLKADGSTEQRILDYLNQNASDVLAEKINAGTKTLAGAVKYATEQARKLAKSDGCVCVDDATVFGWIIHFFEEDDIAEQPKKEKAAVKLPGGVKEKAGGQKTEDRGQRTEGRGRKTDKTAKPEEPAKPAEPSKPKGPIILELFSMDQSQALRPNKAYVAASYDPKTGVVKQCYGKKNSTPPKEVRKFVERVFSKAKVQLKVAA